MDGGVDIRLHYDFWETILNTWIVMAVLVVSAWAVTRRLKVDPSFSRSQHTLEVIVETIQDQIADISKGDVRPYIPFVGTLFLFVFIASVLGIMPSVGTWFPGGLSIYSPPTAALETTVALALCVLVAVPVYTVAKRGVGRWLKGYIEPTPFMLPFHVIGDVSRTLALAVRLFGNMMSGVVIGGILFSVAPYFFPMLMQIFGLLMGTIQAYIFAILAMVYIASAVQVQDERISD